MPRNKAIVTPDGVVDDISPRLRPALSPEAQENRMVSLAMKVAEQRMLNNTASAQEIVYWLKYGSTLAQLEKVKLENEIANLQAKTETLRQAENNEKLYKDAIEAMSRYSGAKKIEDIDEK